MVRMSRPDRRLGACTMVSPVLMPTLSPIQKKEDTAAS